jgi:hypothetical protein
VTSLGEYAFRNCFALTEIVIPENVTELGGKTFECTSALKSIVVTEGNPKYDSRENCNAIIETTTNTLLVGCSQTTIPESVTAIEGGAFLGSTMKEITIPNSVKRIGNYAFKWCFALKTIAIPKGVKSIGYEAFCECKNLTTVTLPAGVDKIDDHAFWWCNKLKTIYVPAKKTEYYMKRLPKHLQWKIVEME